MEQIFTPSFRVFFWEMWKEIISVNNRLEDHEIYRRVLDRLRKITGGCDDPILKANIMFFPPNYEEFCSLHMEIEILRKRLKNEVANPEMLSNIYSSPEILMSFNYLKYSIHSFGNKQEVFQYHQFLESVVEGNSFAKSALKLYLKNPDDLSLKKRNSFGNNIDLQQSDEDFIITNNDSLQTTSIENSTLNTMNHAQIVPQLVVPSELQKKIVQLLGSKGPMTRKDMVSQLQIARTTIYDTLAILMQRNIVDKRLITEKRRGRPKVFYTLKGSVICA